MRQFHFVDGRAWVVVRYVDTDKGQVLLMRGRDLWIYMPNLSQPIRLALSQRLTGQVANGDLARANFSGDYARNFPNSEHRHRQRHARQNRDRMAA